MTDDRDLALLTQARERLREAGASPYTIGLKPFTRETSIPEGYVMERSDDGTVARWWYERGELSNPVRFRNLEDALNATVDKILEWESRYGRSGRKH